MINFIKNNIFDNPDYYRKLILNEQFLLKCDLSKNNGKSLICVFFTAFCGIGCPFCFFRSPNYKNNIKLADELENRFNKKAVKKFIKFANDANVGYLQISGGGEPFLEKNAIIECIKGINADRIILITSGFWACNEKNGEKYLEDLYEATLKRKHPARVTIRVSISEHHNKKLKDRHLINLLNIFNKKYKNDKNFTLQLKTFENDNALVNALDNYFDGYKLKLISNNSTDDNLHIKIIPWKYNLTLKSGYSVIVGKSRVFYSNLRPNINNKQEIKKNIEVYDNDLFLSQRNNSSIVYNSNGNNGLDWIVEYNGNVCIWQNRVQDNLLNIYEDSYKDVLYKTYHDVLTYSYIDKWGIYRNNIVNEVSPKSVLLMKSVNIRDYAWTLLFYEEKVRLYYTIRVIQDYLIEKKINKKYLKKLPKELFDAINMSKNELKKLYNKSTYSILDQEFKMPINKNEFYDLLELIKLGHYNISKNKIKKAINYYNSIYKENLKGIEDIVSNDGINTERRLTKRMMKRKKIKNENNKKYFYIYRHGETNWNVENRIKWQLETIDTKFTECWLIQINGLKEMIRNNKIEAVFFSDLNRARETSEIINESLKLPLYYSENFRGLNMWNFQGKKMKEFLSNKNVKKAFFNYNVKIPWWESINELIKRFIEGIEIIYNNYTYDKVTIISHGAAISNLKAYISNSKYENIDYCVIKLYNNKYDVVDFGCYK